MDDVVKIGDEDSNKELITYMVLKSVGDGLVAGELIYLPKEQGDSLVEAGLVRCATDSDVNPDMTSDKDVPVLTASFEKLEKSLIQKSEEIMSEVVNTAVTETKREEVAKDIVKEPVGTVPAETTKPIYKSNAAYLRDVLRHEMSLKKGKADQTLINRLTAYDKVIRTKYEAMGYDMHQDDNDPEYKTKSILGVNESINNEGLYLVNPEFSKDVYSNPHSQPDLQQWCTQIDAQSNLLNRRYVNEQNLNTSGFIYGGLNIVPVGEGQSFTSSLPMWGNFQMTLNKFTELVYYSQEVLQDNSYSVESAIDDYTRKAFVYAINYNLLNGNTMEGIVNSPGLVSVTHSSNDTRWSITPSTCLTYADLASMWAQVYPDSQTSSRGVWLFNPGLLPSLLQMTYTFSGSNPAYGIQYDAQRGLDGIGDAGGAGTPYRIFSKPAFPIFAMAAPGVTFDIAYVDFATVLHYRKPFRMEVSRHVQFLTDQIAAKWVYRGDVKAEFRNAITGPQGIQTYSAYVTRTALAGT